MATYPSEKEADKDATPFAVVSIDDEKLGHDDFNKYIEGSEGVTQHDLDTLRHVSDRLPYTAWLVVIVEFAERFVDSISSVIIMLTDK